MAFRNVRTMSRFCSYSSGPVPRFLLLCCNAAPRTTIFSSSSTNFRYFSSETSTPVPSETAENRINSMVKNFSVSSMFQNWKNKFQPVKEVPVVDAKEETNRTAIDLGLTSVVKVFTVSSKPRIFQPWQISMESQCTGSGFVISGKRILTNAHVVADHTSVKVRKHGSPKKYKAKVRAIGHECDLAVLEVNNEEFWEGMNSLELADIPPLSAEVFVVGYPEGGDTISVTKGVVSRVGLTEYSHTATELMTIQIDAAINSGNSGGPAIMGNKVAGVAFESLFFADNIGYIIPTPIINRFLDGVEESGQHVSFCSINLTYMTMENDDNRGFFQMSKEMTGILIREINPLSGARKFLKEQDVILAIDGVPIGNDSKVRFRNNERINFEHLISMKKPCDTALFKVLREGKVHEFNINLKPVQPLVPVHQFDKPPSYYIFGGIVFTPLSQPYIDRAYICECATKKMSKKDGEQIIIISQIFEDDITTGHDHCEDKQVKKVNGVQVDNLKHLCQLIEECSTKYLKLDLEEGIVLSLNYKSAEKATSKILKNLKIPSAKSDDLQPKQLNMRRNVPRQIKKR